MFRIPLLAGLSTGANVTRFTDNTTLVQWNRSYAFDLRFYDKTREQILYFFLQFMGILIRCAGHYSLCPVIEESGIIFLSEWFTRTARTRRTYQSSSNSE